jgi:hypothetical protein
VGCALAFEVIEVLPFVCHGCCSVVVYCVNVCAEMLPAATVKVKMAMSLFIVKR